MWEFTIIGNANLNLYLKNIELTLKQKTGVILAANKNTLSIACKPENKQKVIKLLKPLISETIVLFYKEQFFKNHINLNYLSDQFKTAFIKCLVLFDFEEDYIIAFNELELINAINLDSFFHFKLKQLKNKWQQLLYVLNSNSTFLESEALLDLLKFLISSIKPKRESVDVYFNGVKFVLSDENNNILMFNNSESAELSLISGLITLAPKTINLHCAGVLSNNTFKIIYYVFNKKVNLLV